MVVRRLAESSPNRPVLRNSPIPTTKRVTADSKAPWSSYASNDHIYRLEDARQSLRSAAASFARETGSIFRSLGINIIPEPVLSLNEQGRLTLSNRHPQHDDIETALAADPLCQQRFTLLANAATELYIAENQPNLEQKLASLTGNAYEQQQLLESVASFTRKLVFQLALCIDGPALFFTVGHLSW